MLVEQTKDGGTYWQPIPLRLTAWSMMLLWTSAAPFWPPEVPIEMGYAEGEVWFDYVDAPDEEPRWMRKPAIWRAMFLQSESRWRITRLREI